VKTYKERGGRYAGAGRKERTGLTKWFGENWVDLSRPIREDGEVIGYEPCGRKRSDDPADYPKCRPAREAMRMSKEEVADAVRRKRRAEASAPARGSRARAPKRVATYRNPEGSATPTTQTQTEAFRRWFGDSKVVDERGEPLVVYHGTNKGGFYAFDTGEADRIRKDMMFFTDDYGMAQTYTRGRGDPTPPIFPSVDAFLRYVKTEGDDSIFGVETDEDDDGVFYTVFSPDGYKMGDFYADNEQDMEALLSDVNSQKVDKAGVYEVYLRIVDPLVVDAKGANWDEIPMEDEDEDGNPRVVTYTTNELAHMAKDMGLDGLIIRDVYDSGRFGRGAESGDVYVVFDEKQIKSAHNNVGTFDPTDDDIRRNPRKPPPLTERELADLPRANAFWMDFEIENGPEYLPAAMQDAQWPADRDDVELARVVLAFFYRTAPGNY
jgi:hypothetical protein